MKHDPKVCFIDVLNACQQILDFTKSVSFEEYRSNDLITSAVERKFEIIGEALNRVRKTDPSLLEIITDSEQIIGFRNVIIHGYDAISDRIVWDTVKESIPLLLREVSHILSK